MIFANNHPELIKLMTDTKFYEAFLNARKHTFDIKFVTKDQNRKII